MRRLRVLLCLLAVGCSEARPAPPPVTAGQARPSRAEGWKPAPVPRVQEVRRRAAPFPPRNPFITGSDLVPVRR